MSEETAFQSYIEGALAGLEIEVDEVERAVIKGVWALYEPGIRALLEADLDGVEQEMHPDIGRAPR